MPGSRCSPAGWASRCRPSRSTRPSTCAPTSWSGSRGGARIDYLICDEAQFYSEDQVDQLAAIVDELGIDVYAFGIMTDFRTRLFPGSARLVELSDRVQVLQVEALCWCGARAIHNARTVNGEMVVEGSQVMVGDTTTEVTDHGRLRGALPHPLPVADDGRPVAAPAHVGAAAAVRP